MKKVISLLLIGLVASLAVHRREPGRSKEGPSEGHSGREAARGGSVVQAVGPDSVTLTRRKGHSVTVQVDGDTKIVVNGKAATLSDVKVGYVALARLAKAVRRRSCSALTPLQSPGTIVAGQVDSVGPTRSR